MPNINAEILCKEDPNDLYGDFTCVINPPGYDFVEDATYTINGQGGMFYSEELQKWRENFGLAPQDAKYEYGYNLHRAMYNLDTDRTVHEDIKIPGTELVKYFVSLSDFDTYEEMKDFIKAYRRDHKINDILSEE